MTYSGYSSEKGAPKLLFCKEEVSLLSLLYSLKTIGSPPPSSPFITLDQVTKWKEEISSFFQKIQKETQTFFENNSEMVKPKLPTGERQLEKRYTPELDGVYLSISLALSEYFPKSL